MDEIRLLRISEVAELLRISRTKVYELVASGQIPSLHLGRIRRIPFIALRDWINAQTERATSAYSAPPQMQPSTRNHPSAATPTPRKRPVNRTRTPTKTKTGQEKTEVAPFFEPWMPRPMDREQYRAWLAHLDGHPDEKARVLEAAERHWYGGSALGRS